MLQSLGYVLSCSTVNLSGLLISVQHLTQGRLLRWRQMCSLSCTPVHSCRSAIRRQARGTPLPLPAAPDEIKGVNRQRKWESCSENPPTQSAATTKSPLRGTGSCTVQAQSDLSKSHRSSFQLSTLLKVVGKEKGQALIQIPPPPPNLIVTCLIGGLVTTWQRL